MDTGHSTRHARWSGDGRAPLMAAWGYALVLIVGASTCALLAYITFKRNLERQMQERSEGYARLIANSGQFDYANLDRLLGAGGPGDDLAEYVHRWAKDAARSTGARRVVIFEREGGVAIDSAGVPQPGALDYRLRTDAVEIERAIATRGPASSVLYDLDTGKGPAPHQRSYAVLPRDTGENGDTVFLAAVELPADYPRKVAKLGTVVMLFVAGFSVFVIVSTQIATRAFLRLRRRYEAEHRRAELSQFSAAIAHEIKNPLAAMLTGVQLLARGLDPKKRELAGRLEREVKLLDRIVRDFLAFARGAQRVPEATTAGAVLAEVRAQLTPAQAEIFAATGDMGGELTIDKAALVQALANLVKNACQAALGPEEVTGGSAVACKELSPPNEREATKPDRHVAAQVAAPRRPTVSAAVARAGRRAVFTITDNGAGLPDAVRARLFQPFVSGRAEGTGLGLAITRRLVEDLSGTVVLTRSDDQGAVFQVSVPAHAASK